MATVMRQICDLEHEVQVDSEGPPLKLGLGPITIEADVCAEDRHSLLERLQPFIALLRPREVVPQQKPPRRNGPPKGTKQPQHNKTEPCKKGCGRLFSRTGLTMHENTCLGPMPPGGYPCGECDVHEHLPAKLLGHRYEVHGIDHPLLAHKCTECGRAYVYEHTFRKHQRDEHGMETTS